MIDGQIKVELGGRLLRLLTLLVEDMEPDIGADGYSSVSAEQREAKRVLSEMKQTAEQSPLSNEELRRGVPCATTVDTDDLY